jgi:hypothetical protein
MLWFHHVADPKKGAPFNVCVQTIGDDVPASPITYIGSASGTVHHLKLGSGWSGKPGLGAHVWGATEDGAAEPTTDGWVGTVSSYRGIAAITDTAPTFEQALDAAKRFVARARAQKDAGFTWATGGTSGRLRVVHIDDKSTPVALEPIL